MTANTIEGLRKNQWGFEGTKAQGVLTVALQPTATETFVIGDETYTFVASGASADGQINVGANLAAAKVNIVAAINGTDGWNHPNPAASAAAFVGDNCTITARRGGLASDSIVFTEALAGAGNVMNGSGTLGGTTAGADAKGTAVAATSQIAIEKLEWGDDDENLYQPKFATGILARNRGAPTAVQHGTRFSFGDQPVVWEQLPHWLSLAIKGDVVPLFVGGSPDIYRWTFTRAPDANPNPHSVTLERRFSNGAGDNVDQRAAYAMLSEFALKWAMNEHLRMSGSGFARRASTTAITGSLSLPASELGVSALSTIYIDATWGAIGGTLVSEQVVGWEFMLGTGLFPRHTAEGRTDLDYTKHQINAEEVTLGLKLTLLMDPTTYAAERAAAAAGTTRAVQVKVAGSGSRLLKLNSLMRHQKPELFKIGEQEGQDIVEMELWEAPDSTNFFQAILEHPSVYDLT